MTKGEKLGKDFLVSMTSCEITHDFKWIRTAKETGTEKRSGVIIHENEAQRNLRLKDMRQPALEPIPNENS
jgi:hypothetical protein